jgi:hypothetical protein
MLLIMVLGLFAQLALASGENNCDCENKTMSDFDWKKLGIILLIVFLKQAGAKTADWVNISLVVPLNKIT